MSDPKGELRAPMASGAAHTRMMRYIGVGGASTIVYWIVMLVVARFRHFNPTAASVIAYLAGFLTAYTGHRYFTYCSAAPLGAELRRFLTTHAVCFVLGNVAFWYVASRLGASVLLAGVALTGISFAITYAASEFWVFQDAGGARKPRG